MFNISMNGSMIGASAFVGTVVYNGALAFVGTDVYDDALGNGDSDGVRYGVLVFFVGLHNFHVQTRGLHFVCNIAS